MPYPESYEPAEHRRALGAMLYDLLNDDTKETTRGTARPTNAAPTTPVLRMSDATGDRAVVASLGPSVRPGAAAHLA